MEIRKAANSDLNTVLDVETRAFGNKKGPEIANLVNDLLNDPSAMPLLSLLAVDERQATGHILFTKARITSCENSVSAAILAPLAVIPEAQSCGIGGQLVKEGLKHLSESGVEVVFVLGHPEYYPRHGFRPAGVLGFEAPYTIPEEHAGAWMVQELRSGLIGSVSGKIICAEALDRPEHWRE